MPVDVVSDGHDVLFQVLEDAASDAVPSPLHYTSNAAGTKDQAGHMCVDTTINTAAFSTKPALLACDSVC